MAIKVTNVALRDIEGLDPLTRKDVLTRLRKELLNFADSSPSVKLTELGSEVHVFKVEPSGMRVLFKRDDVDNDGEKDVVILTVVDREQLAHLQNHGSGRLAQLSVTDDLPRSARIGHEVLSQIAGLR